MQQSIPCGLPKTVCTSNIPGRMRIRNEVLKNNVELCNQLVRKLSAVNGIVMVAANRYTGSILVIYKAAEITYGEIENIVGNTLKAANSFRYGSSKVIHADFKQKVLLTPDEFRDSRNVLSNECRIYNLKALFPQAKAPDRNAPWHTLTVKEAAQLLDADIRKGLSSAGLKERLHKYGLNKLESAKRKSIISMILNQFDGFIIKLLLGAAGMSLLLGQATDALTILAIIALEAALGVWQEFRAKKSLDSLRQMAVPTANIIRDGRKYEIAASHIVPGDIICLEAGSTVPADARIIESHSLEVVEASLTGEAQAVPKQNSPILQCNLPLGDRKNMVYMGTSVIRGRGRAIVTGTGMGTEMGKIAGMMNEAVREKTPLQINLDKLARMITWGCIGICGVITFGGVLAGHPLSSMLSTSVSLAVGAIPEGLSTVLAISMAFGAQRMAGKNAIVKTMPSVETLSCMKVICTDKTGTLTRNEMTAKEIYMPGKFVEITGEGYGARGNFRISGKPLEAKPGEDLKLLLTSAALCNNAELIQNSKDKFDIKGDPTEAALLIAAKKSGILFDDFHCFKREHEIPFDSFSKKMTAVCSDAEGKYYVFSKGAIDAIIAQCTKIQVGALVESITSEHIAEILNANENMAGRALRVLGFAYKPLGAKPAGYDGQELDGEMIFQGLIGVMDPPRAEVKEAIRKCHAAGIRVVMITGDHKSTAAAIARSIGLLTDDGIVLSGEDLAEMKEEELADIIERVRVFARTCPEQKLKIVKAFKKRGYIVAMTGDGVNDAPALAEAHIGIAMGKSGTDVTKDAASIILTDDNFTTVVRAVEEGRTINRNIKKFVTYVLTGNLAEVLVIFLVSALGFPLPLIPGQILMFNLVTEGIPALSLGVNSPEKDIMNEPPRDPAKSIFDAKVKRRIITGGMSAGLATLGIFAAVQHCTGNLLKARTMAFTNLVAYQMLNVFKYSSRGTVENKYLIPSIVISMGMVLACLYIPALSGILGMSALNLAEWAVIGLAALISHISPFVLG